MEAILKSLPGPQLMLLGGMLLLGLFLFRRTVKRIQISQSRNPLAEVQREVRQQEQAQRNSLHQQEVRLHEFSREVEGRIQTRIATLEQMIQQADDTIQRLESVLAALEHTPAASTPDSQHEQQLKKHLSIAGFSPKEVVHILGNVSVEINEQPDEQHRADAA